ncbi:hypothetical protein [Cellulosimicrobium cellulans]|uniref:hypothetical protein n=1 Tax=Cellulosimicrobium cellulans TaxID=1710 RepID=UPI003C57A7C9
MSEKKIRYFQAEDHVVARAMSSESQSRLAADPYYTEVQVVPVDAIVIRREDVPKVHVVGGLVTAGEDENGDPYSCSAEANPNWPYWYGINALAVAEYLREHPPVDEEQVAAVRDALLSADSDDVNYIEGDDAWKLARRMVEHFGVRVEAKS